MKTIGALFVLLFSLTLSPSVFSRVITSASDPELAGASQINFDTLPLGYIEDTATGRYVEGATFTSDDVTIQGVTFSNGGDTHYFPRGVVLDSDPSPEKTIEIEGLSINPGEDAWSFGRGLSIPPSPNKILLQRTFESRLEVLDSPGRLNIIKIMFNHPVTAFGLIIGGNQPGQTLKIYNTDNELIEEITRPTDQANYFAGYALNTSDEKKIHYALWGNKHSHDRLYIDNLAFIGPASSDFIWGIPRWLWVPPWVPSWLPAPIAIGLIGFAVYMIRRRRDATTNPPRH